VKLSFKTIVMVNSSKNNGIHEQKFCLMEKLHCLTCGL
jgi:hypothetical protein